MTQIQDKFYKDDAVVKELTNMALASGHSILQAYKLDSDDKRHTELLLKSFNPPHGASILDAGCGVGEVSKLMKLERPDLKFTLLNISQSQLDLCPPQFRKIKGDFHEVAAPSQSFDAIMFNYSIGHADIDLSLREAARLLKRNGLLFIYDMEATECVELQNELGYTAFRKEIVIETAKKYDLEVIAVEMPEAVTSEHLRNILDVDSQRRIFNGVRPVIYRFQKIRRSTPEIIKDALARHKRIALMYSGGKDSTACLYLLKEYWDSINVVWVNTGAAFPEILANMEKMRGILPHFVEVKSDQPSYIEHVGYPTEVLPIDYTPFGQAIGGEKPLKLSSYIDCCATNIWRPAMDAARSLGATLIVRGQKNCDAKKSPMSSGYTENGIEYLFPIEDWSHEEVRQYLCEQNFAMPDYYKLEASSLDCWNCTAYCYEHKDKLGYMKSHHPHLHEQYSQKLDALYEATQKELTPLENLVRK